MCCSVVSGGPFQVGVFLEGGESVSAGIRWRFLFCFVRSVLLVMWLATGGVLAVLRWRCWPLATCLVLRAVFLPNWPTVHVSTDGFEWRAREGGGCLVSMDA